MRIVLVWTILACACAQRTFKTTADDYLEVYVDGEKLLDRSGSWPSIKSVDPSQCYTSVAIKAEDIGNVAMVIATFDDGTQTDGSWKITTELQDGWTGAFFDDSDWEAAYEIGQKGTLKDPDWTELLNAGIDDSAYYIWTKNYRYSQGGDHIVYIRKTFDDCVKFNCGNRNPCDPLLIPNRYFYANFDETKYVQCDAFGKCFEMDCHEGDIWDDETLTCVPK